MHSKNLSAADRYHMARIKEMDCAVCGEAGPSDAHHIEQGQHFLCIPLCKSCHQDNLNGIHGAKVMWKVMRKTEMSCLNDTWRLLSGRSS